MRAWRKMFLPYFGSMTYIYGEVGKEISNAPPFNFSS